MLRSVLLRLSVVLFAGKACLVGCGHDQRAHQQEPVDGEGSSASVGAENASPNILEHYWVDRDVHIQLETKRDAGAACAVQVGDAILTASEWEGRVTISKTELPVDLWSLSEVVDEVRLDGYLLRGCSGIVADDRVYFLWSGTRYNESKFGGFTTDLDGEVMEGDLGDSVPAHDKPEIWGAAGRAGALGILERYGSSASAWGFSLLEESGRRDAIFNPVATCEPSSGSPTVVATPTGFAAAFFCGAPDVLGAAPQLTTVFISGDAMDVHQLPVLDQDHDRQVALWPHWDGTVFVAYGPSATEGQRAESARVYQVTPREGFGYTPPDLPDAPTPGYSFNGESPVRNESLEFASPFGAGLALASRFERAHEDAPPTHHIDYCFLDATALPLESCEQADGEGLHLFESGLVGLEQQRGATVIRLSNWYQPAQTTARPLFDAGLEHPQALACSGGQCQILVESSTLDKNNDGYRGFSFTDVSGVFDDSVTQIRAKPTSFVPFGGGLYTRARAQVDWDGGDAQVLAIFNNVGPLVMSFDRGEQEIVSNEASLASFSIGPWRESGGSRVFGEWKGDLLTGVVASDGALSTQTVVGDPWGQVFRCGDRYLNQTGEGSLAISVDAEVTEFRTFSQQDPLSFSVLGCTDGFVLLHGSFDDAPFQVIRFADGLVTQVTALSAARVMPRASLVGKRLAVFSYGEPLDGFTLNLLDETGVVGTRHLPTPEGRQLSESLQGSLFADDFVVPQRMDADLSHVALIWEDSRAALRLSSWRLGTGRE